MSSSEITNKEFFAERGIEFTTVMVKGSVYNVNRAEDEVLLINNFGELRPQFDPETDKCPNLHLSKNRIVNIPSNVGDNMIINCTGSEQDFCAEFVKQKSVIVDHIITQTYAMGFETPSQVQSISTAELVLGKDSLVQSKSGTGKTYTFLSGLLWHFDPRNPSLQHIYITCSHEIARQIHEQAVGLMPPSTKISIFVGNKQETKTTISGGFKNQPEKQSFRSTRELIEEAKTAQIVVCTLGKFYDLFSRNAFDLGNLKSICVDEFDKIVTPDDRRKESTNISTDEQIKKIIMSLPEKTQRVFLSATVTPISIETALKYFRYDFETYGTPYIVLLNKDDFTLEGIDQFYVESRTNREKREIMADLISGLKIKKIIVFVNTVNTADDLKDYLDSQGLGNNAVVMHGQLSGNDRTVVHDAFKVHGSKILIATDVISRGLDIHDVNIVINYDMPESPETYIHRAGRTGRYGRKGTVINIILKNNYVDENKKIAVINTFSNKGAMERLPENLGSIGC